MYWRDSVIGMEVAKFQALHGFINVYLKDEQFMDRIHIVSKKRNVTAKDSLR